MNSEEDETARILQQIALWLFYFTLITINIGLMKIVISIMTATFNGLKGYKEAIQIQQLVDIWTDFGDIAELISSKVLRQKHEASEQGEYIYFAQSFKDVPSELKQGFSSVEQRLQGIKNYNGQLNEKLDSLDKQMQMVMQLLLESKPQKPASS